jgi:hypothetical protein
VFVSNRGKPLTPAGFAKMIERAVVTAKLRFKAHPAMFVTRAVSSWRPKDRTPQFSKHISDKYDYTAAN